MRAEKNSRKWLIPVIIIGVAVLVAGGIFLGSRIGRTAGYEQGKAEAAARPELGEDGRIGYAVNGVVALDETTLQDMVDALEKRASETGITLDYKDLMVSDDGVNFACYIGNAAENPFDLFITIYGDQNLTEEWFLSELIRPGTAFSEVAFQKKLAPGKYTGYLVYTQVGDEDKGDSLIQTIHAQVATTIQIVVNEY